MKHILTILTALLLSLPAEADDFESTLIKVAHWQLQHLPPKHRLLDAANGVFHTGLLAAYEVTLFKSVGVAIQDLCAASRALANARQLGLGTPLHSEEQP
jgi:ornithine cyclodeaminase/alanine dehydrogenase-like protein (mu-crystallin family)